MNNFQTLTLNEKDIVDFASARNRLLRSATSDWVFFVDTDEVVSDALKKEIASLSPNGFNGFYIKRKIVFLGKEIGEDKVLRLARKESGLWRRKVHETWDIKGRVGTLDNYIIHNTAKDMHSYIKKINNYSDLHAKENLREGKRSNLLKIIFYPMIKFVQNILQGRGFVFSMLQSLHSFLGWAKLWELQKR